jgi:hypothetical protein
MLMVFIQKINVSVKKSEPASSKALGGLFG